MKIKIMTCDDKNVWYKDKIGEVIEVTQSTNLGWYEARDKDNKLIGYIDKSEAVVLSCKTCKKYGKCNLIYSCTDYKEWEQKEDNKIMKVSDEIKNKQLDSFLDGKLCLKIKNSKLMGAVMICIAARKIDAKKLYSCNPPYFDGKVKFMTIRDGKALPFIKVDTPIYDISQDDFPKEIYFKAAELNQSIEDSKKVIPLDNSEPVENKEAGTSATAQHYIKGRLEPIEVLQRILTQEQFIGFLVGNMIKYKLRAGFKGDKKVDLKKAAQYEMWVELAEQGITIEPLKHIYK
jgi:hypothetical protein